MNVQIVPTITASTPFDYAHAITQLSFAPRLHVDVTDGQFAPNLTVNLNQIYFNRTEFAATHDGQTREIDLHLMIKLPEKWLHQIVALNPTRAIFHAEIVGDNATKIRDYLAKFGIKFGVAILPKTSIVQVVDMIKMADYVLIFGGHLGFQGGVANLTQLSKVSEIHVLNSTCEIAWDGGANAENLAQIIVAGVNVVNVGAAIAGESDPEKTWSNLTRIAQTI